MFCFKCKMNETVNTFLLAGEKFMPEMHLKQPGFTYSACDRFTKNKEIIEEFMQTRNTSFIYKNELDKACFQHDIAYSKSKDLAKRTQSDKFLRDKAFKIASEVYRFFDKNASRSGIANETNYQLANELQKPILKKYKKRKVYLSFIETIFGVLI